jgi:hypothetical protein
MKSIWDPETPSETLASEGTRDTSSVEQPLNAHLRRPERQPTHVGTSSCPQCGR